MTWSRSRLKLEYRSPGEGSRTEASLSDCLFGARPGVSFGGALAHPCVLGASWLTLSPVTCSAVRGEPGRWLCYSLIDPIIWFSFQLLDAFWTQETGNHSRIHPKGGRETESWAGLC